MTAKTKHAFVDDNPYLVYSGDVDTSYSGDSGGGGGGGGGDDEKTFFVTITGENPMDGWSGTLSDPETLSSDKSYTEIVQAIADGKTVIAKTPRYDLAGEENFAFLPLVYYGKDVIDNKIAINFEFVNLSESGYDVYHVWFKSEQVTGFIYSRTFT